MDRVVLVRLALLLTLALSHGSVLFAQTDERVSPSERVTTFVYVRAEPNAQSDERGRLQKGQSLPFVASVPRWYEVRLPNGSTGFVSKSWTRITHGLGPRQEDELRIHQLNVGTGSCAIVECPGANAPPMIVDCGSTGRTGDDLTAEEAAAYVQAVLSHHTAAPNVVLSHGDTDHYSLIPTILEGVQAANIWLGGERAEYKAAGFSAYLEAQKEGLANIFDETKLPANWHNDGDPIDESLSCGDASAFVLTVNTGTVKNAHSLVLLVEYHEFSTIFSGDAEGSTEDQAMKNFDNNVKTTVLTGSHHGAHTRGSNRATWVTNTAPEVMIYSAGVLHSHPSCDVVPRFTTLAQTTEHPARCGEGGHGEDKYRNYRTTRAEYMTKSVGTIIITSNGHSPLALHCTKSNECGVKIPH